MKQAYCILHNVTLQRQHEVALRQSEANTKAVFDNASEAIVLLNDQGRYLRVNPAACRMSGYTEAELCQRAIWDLMPAASREPGRKLWQEFLATGHHEGEYPAITRSGVEQFVEYRAVAHVLAGTHLITLRDITARKRSEERLNKINAGLLSLGYDYQRNLQTITSLCGELLEADCALYNRLEEDQLCVLGQWKAPPEMPSADKPQGHICYDVIRRQAEGALVIRDLQKTEYVKTDPNVATCGLRTYVGHPVRFGGSTRGSLCVVFTRDCEPDDDALRILGILAAAVGQEEERKRAEDALRDSEGRYRLLVECQNDLVVKFTPDRRLLYASPSYCRTFGKTEAELLNCDFLPLVHENDRPAVLRSLEQLHRAPHRCLHEERAHTATGWRWLEWSDKAVLDAQGQVSEIIAVGRDITEQKQAEEAARERQAILTSLYRASAVGIGLSRNRVIVEVNDHHCEMTGYTREELIGQNARMLYACDEDYELVGRALYELSQGRNIGSIETRWRRKDGSLCDVLMSASALDPADPQAGVTVTALDISGRKQAEAQIRRLSRAMEQSPASVVITDLQGNIEYVNSHFTQVTGYRAEEVLGRNPRLLKSGHTPPQEYSRLWSIISQGGEWRGEFHNRKKNGKLYWELASISALRDAEGRITHYLAVKEDITERKQSHDRIREQAALLDQTQDAILVVGMDRRFSYCNRSAERLYGLTSAQLIGKSADNVLFADQYALRTEVYQTALSHGTWLGEIRQTTSAGASRIIHSRWQLVRNAANQPESFLVVNTDVTDKKRLEEQFLRAQRMESIGTLAGGVAHDLNNIFAPILMATDVLRTTAASEEDEAMLSLLKESAQRGAGIVKQLLTFGRGLEGQRADFSPRTLLKEMVKVIQETFPKSISLDQRFPKDVWAVHADPTQIHQVLLNLCVNARDAMPRGGKLTIAAENLVLDEHYATLNPEAEAGRYVVLLVSDTGTGVPPEILDKIFDPFFTTKEQGKGTGLGLSTVLGIVKSHGGFVQVRSRPNEGTQFKVYLPALHASETAQADAVPRTLPQGKGEVVLFVDDEESIRQVAQRMLEANGYRALTAADGAEGLMIHSRRRKEIRVVVTDMVMPVMDGLTLIRALQRHSPDLPIIAMSGLPAQLEEASKAGLNIKATLIKPFPPERLLECLPGILNH